jgi:hypothetical protein
MARSDTVIDAREQPFAMLHASGGNGQRTSTLLLGCRQRVLKHA